MLSIVDVIGCRKGYLPVSRVILALGFMILVSRLRLGLIS